MDTTTKQLPNREVIERSLGLPPEHDKVRWHLAYKIRVKECEQTYAQWMIRNI